MGVTTVALIDTDSDPDTVDLPIPGNDDSIRSIEVILAKLADACLEGRAALPPEQQAMVKPRAAAAGPQPPRRPPPPEPNPAPAGAADSQFAQCPGCQVIASPQPPAADVSPARSSA